MRGVLFCRWLGLSFEVLCTPFLIRFDMTGSGVKTNRDTCLFYRVLVL